MAVDAVTFEPLSLLTGIFTGKSDVVASFSVDKAADMASFLIKNA
jgi:hypothetical protein